MSTIAVKYQKWQFLSMDACGKKRQKKKTVGILKVKSEKWQYALLWCEISTCWLEKEQDNCLN